MLAVIIAANFVVGILIGLSGIGGFFLPVVYAALLAFDVRDALLLGFSAFLLSGLLGSFAYARLGLISLSMGVKLGVSCFFGALLGVWVNLLLPVFVVKLCLYTVVLLSGISLLRGRSTRAAKSPLLDNIFFIFGLGLLVGFLCSLSGAGGALILVPVLVALGEETRRAVGLGILASVFISIPSSLGYFTQSTRAGLGIILLWALLAHGLGVLLGTRLTQKIDQGHLKVGVGYFSVFSAIFLITDLFRTLF